MHSHSPPYRQAGGWNVPDPFFDDLAQRLFAIGLGIDAIAAQLTDPELAARLAQHVAALDDTIEQIRARAAAEPDEPASW
jgi:hypothetical protein